VTRAMLAFLLGGVRRACNLALIRGTRKIGADSFQLSVISYQFSEQMGDPGQTTVGVLLAASPLGLLGLVRRSTGLVPMR